MEDTSIFPDKNRKPLRKSLDDALGATSHQWNTIIEYVHSKYPKAKDEWNFPGTKFGWSFRIKDSKRAIVYLLPRDNYFKVAFVFGQKATDIILKSDISTSTKELLKSAKVYAEGRGVRIDVKDLSNMDEIKFLIDTKLAN